MPDQTQEELDRLLLRLYDRQSIGFYTPHKHLESLALRRLRAEKVASDLGQPKCVERLMYLLLARERDPKLLNEGAKP